ncbi:hypothetical protein J1N35_011491 [Gossypium stocksii]|uniref:Uncharacterized protein n=1 Tax=Gossypium stocksii TaxID=47602 RepID=A0A9D3W3L3_9ROSI|nr:hypothetical protein J1N35_011491 [Gossypium stocksii]
MEVSINGRYKVMGRASTVMDIIGLLGRERLLWYSKGDDPFGVTIVFIITQPINNYNRYRVDPSLTFTVLEHPFSS